MAIYLWSLVHGLVTLSLACEGRCECAESERPLGALELFQQFGEFVRRGLRPEGA